MDLALLEGEVEKRKHAIEEAKAQAKGLLPAGTQAPDHTAGFSPAPKPSECLAACGFVFCYTHPQCWILGVGFSSREKQDTVISLPNVFS